jgi:hypothetical protein
VRDLENMTHILQSCVPPEAVKQRFNLGVGEKGPCLVHGKWSVGDPGLAHQLVGRLVRARGEASCMVVRGNGGGIGNGCHVDSLVGSVRRYAMAHGCVP